MYLKILSGVDFKWPTRNFMKSLLDLLSPLVGWEDPRYHPAQVSCGGGARFMATPLFVCFGLYDLCVRLRVTFFFSLLMIQFRSLDGLPSSHSLVGWYCDNWWISSDVIATRYQFNRQTIRNSFSIYFSICIIFRLLNGCYCHSWFTRGPLHV